MDQKSKILESKNDISDSNAFNDTNNTHLSDEDADSNFGSEVDDFDLEIEDDGHADVPSRNEHLNTASEAVDSSNTDVRNVPKESRQLQPTDTASNSYHVTAEGIKIPKVS